jgi:hypothetical protein
VQPLLADDAEVARLSPEEVRRLGQIQRHARAPVAQKNRRNVAGDSTLHHSTGDSGYCSALDRSPPPATPLRRRSVTPFEACLGAVVYASPSRRRCAVVRHCR